MVSTVDDDAVSFAVVVIFVFVGMGSTVLCREVMVDTSACRCVVILEGAKATTLVDKTNRKVAARMGGLATMIMTIFFKGSKLDSTMTHKCTKNYVLTRTLLFLFDDDASFAFLSSLFDDDS